MGDDIRLSRKYLGSMMVLIGSTLKTNAEHSKI
jgi:hypothetical protein